MELSTHLHSCNAWPDDSDSDGESDYGDDDEATGTPGQPSLVHWI